MARMGTWASLASLALIPFMVGCDSKSDDGLPTAPPLAAQTPADILPHLQYLAARKDYKHVIIIAPISPDVVFPSAWWFHNQARSLGIELTPEELKALDVEALASRFDALPRSPEPGYDITDARHAFNAGIYRLLKGFDASVWRRMNVMEVKGNPANRRVEDVTLGVNGQPLLVVSCLKKDNNTWGVSNIQYKVGKGYQPK